MSRFRCPEPSPRQHPAPLGGPGSRPLHIRPPGLLHFGTELPAPAADLEASAPSTRIDFGVPRIVSPHISHCIRLTNTLYGNFPIYLFSRFKIAVRNLEIRGAGNILGPEQSGHISTVGYEMYCQLLEEATRQLKKRQNQAEAHVDIGVSALVPKQWIAADRQRMDVYRRLTRCTSLEMLNLLEQDLTDAFGPPPRPAVLLMALTELRLLAGIFGIESIIKKKAPDVVLTVHNARLAAAAFFKQL